MSGARQSAPGVVEIRLSGTHADTDKLLAVLEAAPGVEVLTWSAAYPNRRSPGHRVYLIVRLAAGVPETADKTHDRLHPDPNGEPPALDDAMEVLTRPEDISALLADLDGDLPAGGAS